MLKSFLSVLFAISLFSSPAFGGVDFDGVDDWVDCGSASGIDDFNQKSISAWIYLDSVLAGDGSAIVSKLLWDPSYDGWTFQVIKDATPSYALWFWSIPEPAGGNNQWRSDYGDLSLNTWYHVGITYDRTSATTDPVFYVNGVAVNTTQTSDSAKASSAEAGADFNIGKRGKVGHLDDSEFDGKINEVAYWNVILTAAEMEQLGKSKVKRMPLQVRPSALKLYIPMDDEEDGSSADADTFRDYYGVNTCTGNDGANNTGLTAVAESVLTYPPN